MVAGRILAPYLGSSLHQWGALIGVVLLAYIGGYSVYRHLTRKGAWLALGMAGAYVLFFPLWGFSVLEVFLGLPLSLASLASALLVAGIPSFLWASLLPYFQEKAAKKSAQVLAWGSAGNLVGAWFIAFLSVPTFGTRITWLGLGALSWGLAVFLFLREKKKTRVAVSMLAAAAVSLPVGAGAHAVLPTVNSNIEGMEEGSRVLVDLESPYQRIRVWEKDFGERKYRVLGLNQTAQFFWSPDEPWVSGAPYQYYNWSALLASLAVGGRGVLESGLFLGLGGGLVPWQIRKLFESTVSGGAMPRMLAFELDPRVAEVAKEWMPLSQAGKVQVEVGDARQLLRASSEKFQYILADTFLNSYVPFHFTSLEFFQNVRDHLAEDGILVVNLHTVFSASGLLEKIESTLSAVLPNSVAVDLMAGTTLLIASNGALPLKVRIRSGIGNPALNSDLRSEMGMISDSLRPIRNSNGGSILTDDLNDTEQRLYETRRYLVMKRGM